MRFSNSNVLPTSFDCNGCVIGQRTESDRVADGIRSDGERNPIGWRVPSRGCTCLKCTDKAIKYPTKLSSTQQSCQVPNKAVKCTKFLSVVNILA